MSVNQLRNDSLWKWLSIGGPTLVLFALQLRVLRPRAFGNPLAGSDLSGHLVRRNSDRHPRLHVFRAEILSEQEECSTCRIDIWIVLLGDY